MKNRWRSIFAMIIGGLLLVITNVPSDAARRVARGSSYNGTWSVAIYTLRGDCGSIRAALRPIGVGLANPPGITAGWARHGVKSFGPGATAALLPYL